MKSDDEIIDMYYALDEFIADLQSLVRYSEGKIDKYYTDNAEALWCEAQNEKEAIEDFVEKIQKDEKREELRQDYNSRL